MALLASPDVGIRRRALLNKPFAWPGSLDARLLTWKDQQWSWREPSNIDARVRESEDERINQWLIISRL